MNVNSDTRWRVAKNLFKIAENNDKYNRYNYEKGLSLDSIFITGIECGMPLSEGILKKFLLSPESSVAINEKAENVRYVFRGFFLNRRINDARDNNRRLLWRLHRRIGQL